MFAATNSAFEASTLSVLMDTSYDGDEPRGLQWIDRFLDELAVDSCSSGSNSDRADDATSDSDVLLDALLMGTTQHTLAHDERKRHHRESMARLRQERRSRIGRLDAQETRLHTQLRRALAFFERHRAPHDCAEQCRCKAYVALVQEAEELLQEQYALEHQRHAWKRYIKLVAVEAERSAETARELQEISAAADGRGEQPLVGAQECIEGWEASLADARRQLAHAYEVLSRSQDAGVVSSECLGWRAERHIDGHAPLRLCWRFVRRVPSHQASLRELQQRVWETPDEPTHVSRLLGADLEEVAVVETLSADTVITRCRGRETPACLYVNAREVAEDESSVTLIVATLDREEGLVDNRKTMRGVWSLRFSQVRGDDGGDDDGIEIEYTAAVACESATHAERHARECCLALLRWERAALPHAPIVID